jgi:hypothetical protein
MAAIVSSLHYLSPVAFDISNVSGAPAAIIKTLAALINDTSRATRDIWVWLPAQNEVGALADLIETPKRLRKRSHERQPSKPLESQAYNGPTHRLDHPGARQAHLGARRFAPRPLCAWGGASQSIRSAAELRALLESLEGGTAKDDD